MSRTATKFRICTLVCISALFLLLPPASASDGTAFENLVRQYEEARLALINDTTDGIVAHARAMIDTLDELKTDLSATRAGVKPENVAEIRSLIPSLRSAAEALASATDLESARTAFYELTKPLVRWRSAAVVELPAVAYCPMAKRSWLQPEGEVSNPYYGQSMLTCGDLLPDKGK